MTISDLAGSEWESKDGTRALVVLHEAAAWRGDRHFLVKGIRGPNRQRLISMTGLLGEYRRIEATGG
ncbi:hypothetical protein ACFWU5_16400 [Nocardia sp. NPDC058640]|uniref:hypothetical protein n=1 Tax=Nocardia sp. NPDC058640 TaxID=3346571 RepID=UPI003658BDE0